MSRKKTKAERFAQGDTRQRGVKKLAAMLAAEPRVERGLPESSPRLKGDAAYIYTFYARQLDESDLAAMPDLERAAL